MCDGGRTQPPVYFSPSTFSPFCPVDRPGLPGSATIPPASSSPRVPEKFARQCATLKDSYGTRTGGRVSNTYMRYWGYLIAKLTVAGAILLVLREAIVWMFHPARH